ncbi:hypothetical protein RRG08_030238 [Elysia crispata]|uniref:C-type lectin domain-containing protein n=1 Tax=Elysia crispata TaxID=231223 RepID=A0AAE1DZK2_9GAST|nr:hypothetical protein RRG08_030238 [Elysia crispata]
MNFVWQALLSLGLVATAAHCQITDEEHPCNSENAILVPEDQRCLVLVTEAHTWSKAQAFCERRGGNLYRILYGRIENRPHLARCLASIPNARVADLWIDAVGIWSPQYIWINDSYVNPVKWCPNYEPVHDLSTVQWRSDQLSVEYCMTNCRNENKEYTVVSAMSSTGRGQPSTPKCFCMSRVDSRYRVDCASPAVDYNNWSRSYIFQYKPNGMIVTEGFNSHTDSQVMCATVSTKTLTGRNYSSDTCFTENPYLCCIGDASYCDEQATSRCNELECYVRLPHPINKCVLRVNRNRNWFEARAHCYNIGGDLWNLHHYRDLTLVQPQLEASQQYWVGATNYGWSFSSVSTDVTLENIKTRKCGHMFREKGDFWDWGDTVCDQDKQFICEFEKKNFTREQYNNPQATCPWEFVVELPVEPLFPQPAVDRSARDDSDPFPLAAVLSAIVAGIMLLTALALAFGFCWRRGWLVGGFQKVRERLAFIPYFADVGQVADYESHAANMSSVSEHGSQTGLVKGGYHAGGMSSFAMSSSSYTEQTNGGFANTNLDATYATVPRSGTDYMTLQAQMEIKDDAELASLRGSVRRKPEVALVTDNVDMNFTVNKAVNRSHSHAGSERSRSSLDRTMEEIHADRNGVTMSLPERVVEAKYYTTST